MKSEYLSSEELNKMNFGKIGNNVLIDQYVNITQIYSNVIEIHL